MTFNEQQVIHKSGQKVLDFVIMLSEPVLHHVDMACRLPDLLKTCLEIVNKCVTS